MSDRYIYLSVASLYLLSCLVSRLPAEEPPYCVSLCSCGSGRPPLYLGLPGRVPSPSLFGFAPSGLRLSLADCRPLLLKVDSRIKGWDGIMLSFAGRVQLVKSVLMSLQVYWAMAFILPKRLFGRLRSAFDPFFGRVPQEWGMPKFLGNRCVNRLRKVASALRIFLPLTEGS
ncbi:UNVERIFIED_CONTAM: hypothetical protein Slati_2454300 [Sesamum latifolium]|uniref:Secreted protein n=1 Tax=Sesamum latifolium TaxID=2727402 RepID=A0AAW2WEF8_9LAMI